MLGDCLEKLKKLDDESIDLIVTSPPYDKLRNYQDSLKWDFKIFKKIARELNRVIKEGGTIVWVVGDATIKGSETGTSFKQALYFKKIGLNIHDTMIYQKDNCPFPSSNKYYQNFEYMFIFTKGKINTFNPLKDRVNKSHGRKISGTNRQKDGTTVPMKNKGKLINKFGVRFNVWLISEGKRQKEHPAVFPDKLAYDHISSWSNKGDTVLDPFMGSGTVGRQAMKLRRNFIGIEVVPKYFKLAKKKIKNWKEEVK